MSESRVVLVTGATGAIGEAIARQLALGGDEVVLAVRDRQRGERTAEAIRREAPHATVRVEVVDLRSGASIAALAERWEGPLHVLINNAAECPRAREVTAEGIEVQLATNVLGYYRMIRAFQKVLAASRPARVVNVASYWAGGLDLDDLQFEAREYDNDAAYRQSKQADRMLTVAFAERLHKRGIAVNACHPGDVDSRLSNALGFGGHETPDEGARTPVWLAQTDAGRTKGRYYEQRADKPDGFADAEACEALFEAIEALDRGARG